MKIEDIRALAEIMAETGLTALRVTEGDLDLRLERQSAVTVVSQGAPAPVPAVSQPVPAPEAAPAADNLKEVRSPMVGTFYSAPSPESEPYVQIGSRVKKGDVLCVIEAMKLLNEITAETDGEIADICVINGQAVEFGQVLFKIS